MKTLLQVPLKKINFILFALCTVFIITSCSSDDDNSEPEEMMQEQEATLDFTSLVHSWAAQDFVFEGVSSLQPGTSITGLGATVTLEVQPVPGALSVSEQSPLTFIGELVKVL